MLLNNLVVPGRRRHAEDCDSTGVRCGNLVEIPGFHGETVEQIWKDGIYHDFPIFSHEQIVIMYDYVIWG